jgi:predicted nucleic acid-binding protein
MRAIPDTNVVVSALIWGGKPFGLFQAATDGELLLIASSTLPEELHEVLSRSQIEQGPYGR